jgi:hypothetical protein
MLRYKNVVNVQKRPLGEAAHKKAMMPAVYADTLMG